MPYPQSAAVFPSGKEMVPSSFFAIACFDKYSVNNIAGMIRTVVITNWAQSNSYQALCYGINQNNHLYTRNVSMCKIL